VGRSGGSKVGADEIGGMAGFYYMAGGIVFSIHFE